MPRNPPGDGDIDRRPLLDRPDGCGGESAFQAYCDMTADGGGWTLAVHSVLGSEPPTNDMVASTGTPGLATGHTRAVGSLAVAGTAEIRHLIQDTAGGRYFHARYTGQYHSPLPAFGAWTQLLGLGHIPGSDSLLAAHFGQPWVTTGACATATGAPWYYNAGCFSAIPAHPQNGLTQGPEKLGGTAIQRYSIFVRETSVAPAPVGLRLEVELATGGSIDVSPGVPAPCASVCTRCFSVGQIVTLVPLPDPGFVLLEWLGDASGTGITTVQMNGSRHVIARFGPAPPAADSFTLTGPGSAARGEIFPVSLEADAATALSAFSTRLEYPPSRLSLVSHSFASSVWAGADFQSMDASMPGVVLAAAVVDLDDAGPVSIAAGADLAFAGLTFRAGLCTGATSVAFGTGIDDHVVVDPSTVGREVTPAHLTPLALSISAAGTFVRGNANGSAIDVTESEPTEAAVTLADGIFILQDLFAGGPSPPCLDAADANNDGRYNLVDAIVVFQFLFGNPAVSIPEPYLEIGGDTSGSLGCATPPGAVGCS